MSKNVVIHSYKVAYDSGFAPNPFWGVCTLATGMPEIRSNIGFSDYKKNDTWLAGFAPRKLCENAILGNEKLVYLMKITSKMPLKTYFDDKAFSAKKPQLCEWCIKKHEEHEISFLYEGIHSEGITGQKMESFRRDCEPEEYGTASQCTCAEISRVKQVGDNIYGTIKDDDLGELPVYLCNVGHSWKDYPGDDENVLLSNEFYYFGKEAVKISEDYIPNVPTRPSASGCMTVGEDACRFIDYIEVNYEKGVLGRPHLWPEGDDSWKSV